MPSSAPCNIETVLTYFATAVFRENPIDLTAVAKGEPIEIPELRVLDVGCGFGKWAFLIRDTFESEMGQRYLKKDWRLHITAIEAFQKYLTPIQESLYNEIVVGDAREIIPSLAKFDIAIVGDIIEHLSKEDGHRMLRQLLERCNHVIVSTPNGFLPQGAVGGNDYETHRSGWTFDDFKDYTIQQYKIIEDEFFIGLAKAADPENKLGFPNKLELLVVHLVP